MKIKSEHGSDNFGGASFAGDNVFKDWGSGSST